MDENYILTQAKKKKFFIPLMFSDEFSKNYLKKIKVGLTHESIKKTDNFIFDIFLNDK